MCRKNWLVPGGCESTRCYFWFTHCWGALPASGCNRWHRLALQEWLCTSTLGTLPLTHIQVCHCSWLSQVLETTNHPTPPTTPPTRQEVPGKVVQYDSYCLVRAPASSAASVHATTWGNAGGHFFIGTGILSCYLVIAQADHSVSLPVLPYWLPHGASSWPLHLCMLRIYD